MKSKLISLTAILAAGTLVLSGCCNKDTHSEAKQFCLDNGGTYSVITSADEEYGECSFPSGVGCRDDILLTDECNFIADTSDIDTEEKRLVGCEENVIGRIKDIEKGQDITFDWEDEEEAGASFVRKGIASYTKEGSTWNVDLECVADFVDGSIGVTYQDPIIDEKAEANTEEKVDFWEGTSKNYSEGELQAAVDTIMNTVNKEWTVKVTMQKIAYQGDEDSAAQLNYCQDLDSEVTECVLFKTNFFIPEQDAEMAGAFEPNKTLKDYEWYLGRTEGGEWKVLTFGY